MGCRRGKWVVRYSEHVEIYSKEGGNLLASFRVPKDMCKEMFDTYLYVMHNVSVDYRIKRLK